MLGKLLQVKEHKERGLRGKIAQIDFRQQELKAQQDELKSDRLHLWEDWRKNCNQTGVLNHNKLMTFKSKMADLYRKDIQLGEQSKELIERQEKLVEERIALSSALQKNRKEQEKLKYLIEDEINANLGK
ncbi:hypothetical protein [Vibrio marisflavi]|uniref:Flagellar FliJ protein n=1 Tax=Vibrio marisflavi CECT 7928 TaxID=634439 RepID=A0ABN8DWR0_9VIBR|nr:hypothetical protein [Vibrio marisflavi]CAH0535993.1 hypothetical protein VMF7928_00088 [Vibrio marisflavi CECT 7928]